MVTRKDKQQCSTPSGPSQGKLHLNFEMCIQSLSLPRVTWVWRRWKISKWRPEFSPLPSLMSVAGNFSADNLGAEPDLTTTESFVCCMLKKRILMREHLGKGKAGPAPVLITGCWCLLGCAGAALTNWWWVLQHGPTGTAVPWVQSQACCAACPAQQLLTPLQHLAGQGGRQHAASSPRKTSLYSISLALSFVFSIRSTSLLNNTKKICMGSWEKRSLWIRRAGDLDGVSKNHYLFKVCPWGNQSVSLNAVVQRFSWQNCWLCYAWFKSFASIARPNKQSLTSPQKIQRYNNEECCAALSNRKARVMRDLIWNISFVR